MSADSPVDTGAAQAYEPARHGSPDAVASVYCHVRASGGISGGKGARGLRVVGSGERRPSAVAVRDGELAGAGEVT